MLSVMGISFSWSYEWLGLKDFLDSVMGAFPLELFYDGELNEKTYSSQNTPEQIKLHFSRNHWNSIFALLKKRFCFLTLRIELNQDRNAEFCISLCCGTDQPPLGSVSLSSAFPWECTVCSCQMLPPCTCWCTWAGHRQVLGQCWEGGTVTPNCFGTEVAVTVNSPWAPQMSVLSGGTFQFQWDDAAPLLFWRLKVSPVMAAQ